VTPLLGRSQTNLVAQFSRLKKGLRWLSIDFIGSCKLRSSLCISQMVKHITLLTGRKHAFVKRQRYRNSSWCFHWRMQALEKPRFADAVVRLLRLPSRSDDWRKLNTRWATCYYRSRTQRVEWHHKSKNLAHTNEMCLSSRLEQWAFSNRTWCRLFTFVDWNSPNLSPW